jgi:Ca2+-binding RTX toxin-like protein
MPNNLAQSFLRFANLQMASEAFLQGVSVGTEQPRLATLLVAGNSHASRFPDALAQKFADEYEVIAHKANTSTGFSGTLFRRRGTDEYTLSFRSTEFFDDSVRDGKATGRLEIKDRGWAFGQIADMEQWYTELKSAGALDPSRGIPPNTQFDVTGYSLGGHLATAFNILRREEATAAVNPIPNPVRATYTFNGAGTGGLAAGTTLKGVMEVFNAVRNDESQTSSYWTALSTGQREVLSVQASASVAALLDEFNRLKTLNGVEYAAAPNSPPKSLEQIVQANHQYQLAVQVAALSTIPSSNAPVPYGDVNTFATAPVFVPQAQQFASMTEIVGMETDGLATSFVSNSGLHYGTRQEIHIEAQPRTRGGYSIFDAPDLVSDPNRKNFADTHSLTLLVDSLSLIAAMETLDPNISFETTRQIFAAASNAKAQGSVPTDQGSAEGDTLESVLDALRRLVLGHGAGGNQISHALNEEESRRVLNGNTWAVPELRNRFHNALKDLNTGITDLKNVSGTQYTIQSLAGVSPTYVSSTAQVNDDQGKAYRYALKNLNSFAVYVSGTQPTPYNQEAYAKFNPQSAPGGLTDLYLEDRATMLNWAISRNTGNLGDAFASDQASEAARYMDLVLRADGKLTTFKVSPPPILGNSDLSLVDLATTKRFVFGTDSTDVVGGRDNADRLYAGQGTDMLAAGKGSDYLEGGAGMDVYQYRADTKLFIPTNDGNDEIRDTDGKGVLRYTFQAGVSSQVQSTVIGGAAIKQTDAQWLSADGKFRYDKTGADLTVTIVGDAGGTIAIKDFDFVKAAIDGYLGICLVEARTSPSATEPLVGDKTLIDADPVQSGPQTGYDLWGNEQTTDPVFARADELFGHDDRGERVQGLADNDVLFGDTAALAQAIRRTNPVSSAVGGADWIEGGAGRDRIEGGAGNDLIEAGSDGTWNGDAGGDIADGGAGDDELYAESKVTLANAIGQGELENPSGAKGDFLFGGAGDDWLVGGLGRDVLNGGLGRDLIVGGAGSDTIDGDLPDRASQLNWSETRVEVTQNGRVVDFQSTIVGITTAGEPADVDAGDADTIYGGSGEDWIYARGGDDFVDGGVGDDRIAGGAGSDILVGGAGVDVLIGDNGEVVSTVDGDDYLDGGAGNDTLWGNGGSDILIGDAGDDTLLGGAGADILWGGTGTDTLIGGAGKDTYIFNAGDGREDVFDTADIANLADASVVVFGSDIVRGQIKFKLGSLVIDAGNGDEIHFDGFDPNDAPGTQVLDRIEFADGTSMSYQDILDQGFELEGTGGDDDIDGTALNENIDALDGDDIVRAHGGRDAVLGGAGMDELHGGEGDDTLDGGADADALYGDEGSDRLLGGLGEDVLDGGAGDDSLEGGAGADSYVIYGGMGNDAATDGEGGETNVLSLVPGVSLASLRFTRTGDDLQVALKGTADALAIKDYYTRTQAWVVRDSEGAETLLEDAMLIPDPNVGNYVAQLREEARLGQLARAGGAAQLAGWKSLGGGLFEGIQEQAFLAYTSQTTTETFTRVDPPHDVLAVNTFTDTGEAVLSFGTRTGPDFFYLLHRLETGGIASDDAVIGGASNALPQLQTAGDALLSLRRAPQLLNYQHTLTGNSGGVVSYDTGSEVLLANVFYDNELEAYNRFASVRNVVEDPVTGLPLNQMSGPLVHVDMTRVESRYLNGYEIVGGDSANAINAISGGAGIFGLLTLVDGGAGDDTITGSGFLYGNSGDDTIIASRSTLIGGDGDDALTGTGASRFVFTAGESGVDTVAETATYAMAYLQQFYGAGESALRERHFHGGEYRLDLDGPGDYYGSFEEADAVRQGFGFGEIHYIEPLASLAPLVQRGDTAVLDQLDSAGVAARDTVAFGPGLTLADLALDMDADAADAFANPDSPWRNGGTLSVRWGDAGFDIDVPDANYGLLGTDLLADQFGMDENEAAAMSYRLGAGVETFTFADGSSYSLEEVLSRSRLHFGAYAFGAEPGERIIDRRYDSVAFEPGLGSAGMEVSRDGTDLVFSLPFSGGQGRILDWYADPASVPQLFLQFEGEAPIESETLTGLGLVVQGTEDDDVIAGLNGFADTISGGEGDDAISGNSGSDSLSGDEGDDVLDGGADEDFVLGGTGYDILLGGSGSDDLEDWEDNNILDGGAGDDFLYVEGHSFVIGGEGDDSISNYGDGTVIAFNPGDGHDTVQASGNMTLSIGGGIGVADLSLDRDGDDLVLSVGASDSIRLTRAGEVDPQAWPQMTLQLFGSVHRYDLTASIDGDIADHHLGDSETEALGGALAWQYATTGNLNALSTAEQRSVLADAGFGSAAQPIYLTPPENHAPVVSAADAVVLLNNSVLASSLFSVADAEGDAIVQYEFWDSTSGSGHFTLNGVEAGVNVSIPVSAADLALAEFAASGSIGSDLVWVRANDGQAWSDWKSWTVYSSPHLTNALPVVTAGNGELLVGTSVLASSLFSVIDGDDDAITQYEFWDDVAGGGYFAVDGVEQGAAQSIAVSAAELADTEYVAGSTPGTGQVWVRASDGIGWGAWKAWNMTSALHIPNAAPEVAAGNTTLVLGDSVLASSLFSVTDADDDAITQYEFWDSTAGGGHFSLNGVEAGVNVAIPVAAADLSATVFTASGTTASDLVWVRASDGQVWSDWKSWYVNSWPHLGNQAPVASAADATILTDEVVSAAGLFSITDGDNDAIAQVEFWDDVAGGGYFRVNGVQQGAAQAIPVSAADLANAEYVGGASGGTERVWVRANDGLEWGAWKSWNITTALHIPNAAPVVTASNATVLLNDAAAAESLFSVSDADNDTITQYEFWDSTSGNGHFTVNGAEQGVNVAISVSAALLGDTSFAAGAAIGSDLVWVRANDGQVWSDWKSWTVTSAPHLTNAAPVVTALNNGLLRGASVQAASLFAVSDADGDAITQVEFWDDVNGGGQWRVNGVQQAAGQTIPVSAADLANALYVGGANAGTEQVWVRAYDGMAWSGWKNWLMSTEGGLTKGGAGPDTLTGDPDTPILQGGVGNDALISGNPNSLLDGGEGDDTLEGGDGNDLLIGGEGDDTLHTGGGSNVIAYNAGGGVDTIYSDAGSSNALSLGGGLRYQDLSLSKDGDDLVLDTGGGNQLKLKDWYAGHDDVLTLQMIIDASADFDANSSDPLANKRVQSFDFAGLVSAFDTARAGDPGLTSWAVTNALLQYHLAGADDAALGGDLAYQYGRNDALTGIGLTSALDVLASGNFGALAQQLRPLSGLQEGFTKLS